MCELRGMCEVFQAQLLSSSLPHCLCPEGRWDEAQCNVPVSLHGPGALSLPGKFHFRMLGVLCDKALDLGYTATLGLSARLQLALNSRGDTHEMKGQHSCSLDSG
jgi:hypothetical protein